MSIFRYEPAPIVPFRDLEVIERCRSITAEELVKHPNPDFQIRIIPDEDVAFLWFTDMVGRIIRAREEGMFTLRESAIKKMMEGTTTFEEVLRVTWEQF